MASTTLSCLPRRRLWLAALLVLSATVARTPRASADDLDRPPILYATAPADNVVTRLEARLAAGKARLERTGEHGYLPALLRELDVPVSSQVLVFSKTSLQRERISPRTPRALYFNDDVYVGFCLGGEVLEVSAADANLGTAFYTLAQRTDRPPRFTRQTDNCLLCHGSSHNQGYPGHLVRSVYPDESGHPLLSAGSFRTDHASPFKERWGGWYVTGTHGRQQHMGNWLVQNEQAPEQEDHAAGQNVTDLGDRFATTSYLSPHSDLVALLVLEHQAEMHNRLARAALQTRQALHYQESLNRELKAAPTVRWESTTRRIEAAGEALVRYLLFSGELRLTEPVQGTSGFAVEFAGRGPRDAQGRSLRDLDLQTRLFKYPCSYLIYSRAFDSLPGDVRDHVLRRLWEVLTGKDTSAPFAHLSAADRRAILEIVRATKPNLPAYWRSSPE